MHDTISNRFDRIDSTHAVHPTPAEDPALSATPDLTSSSPSLPRERVTSARLAVFVTFTLAGLVFASWAARIADTKESLGLTAGQLGLTLFAASVGSVVGLPLAGRISDRIGATRAVAGVLRMAASSDADPSRPADHPRRK